MLQLEKGSTLNLNKETNKVLSKLRIGAGWDIAKEGAAIDCDLWLIPEGGDPLYYANKTIKGAELDGDDRTGAGSANGADENIAIDVEKLEYDKYTIVINIYNAVTKGQFFKDIERCFIEIEDTESGKVIFNYDISKNSGDNSCLVAGTLVKKDGGLEFTAIEEFSNSDITTVVKSNGGNA